MKSNRVLVRILLLIVALGASAWAQDTASLTGTVTDASGAAVPKAQVVVKNSERGINRTGSSNDTGDFLFSSLPIGSYDLIVSAPGFKKYEAKGVVLRVAEKARVNVALEVGTISTEVVVQGSEVAQVETQSSDLGNTVTGKEISQLELNGRDFTQLVACLPVSPINRARMKASQALPRSRSASTVAVRNRNFEIDGGDALDNAKLYPERLSQHRCDCRSESADL